MDIQRYNFPSKLLEILEDASQSTCVAFDLELSGVPVRPYGKRDGGKATLQQRYAEIKAAAERYQILQIGLTFVKEDKLNGMYELKPYNINVSPVLTERVDVDRDFSFHTGAVEFLNSVGFNFQAPLAIGVPYLSRDEAALAKSRAEERLTRTNSDYDPLVIKPEETETLAFVERLKKAIDAWLKTGLPDANGLLLLPADLSSGPNKSDELSRNERRIIHQYVRQEYPKLVTFTKRGGIQVSHLDERKEAMFRKTKMKEAHERIYRQTGLRWVIEAIAGQAFRNIDPMIFTTDDAGSMTVPSFDITARYQRCQHLLNGNPRPLIGHNMFLDLVYLYQNFMGQLPDTIDAFAAEIHKLFPVIVDTKYLATHECGDMNPTSSLQELAEELDEREEPEIVLHQKHNKYNELEAHHEAGYDSLLTAKVAIRLSAVLEARQSADNSTTDGQLSAMPEAKRVAESAAGDATNPSTDSDDHSAVDGGVSLAAATEAFRNTIIAPVKDVVKAVTQKSTSDEDGTVAQTSVSSGDGASRFATTTPFDALRIAYNYTGDDVDPWGARDEMVQGPALTEWVPHRLMPRWSSVFWQGYMNRLRVFGTQEAMCILDNAMSS